MAGHGLECEEARVERKNRVSFKEQMPRLLSTPGSVDEKPENSYFYANNPSSNPIRNPKFYAI